MTIALNENVLSISDLPELAAGNSEAFRRRVQSALPQDSLQAIEIDLSKTQSVDSCGLGALLAIHKWACNHNGDQGVPIKLLNPLPPVQQILELTRLHRNFEIVKR